MNCPQQNDGLKFFKLTKKTGADPKARTGSKEGLCSLRLDRYLPNVGAEPGSV
jgi:hypothetical protein